MANISLKQESKYLNKLKNLIDFSELSDEQTERLLDELSIIHETRSSKLVYIGHCVANELRRQGYPFAVRGTLADLYLFYLLGITKVSPYDERLKYVLPYQVAIGNYSDPKTIREICFNVPTSVRDDVIDFIRNGFKNDTDIYEYGHVDENDNYVGSSLVLFEKKDNPYQHGFTKYVAQPGLYKSNLPYVTIIGFDPEPIKSNLDSYWNSCLVLNEEVDVRNNNGYKPKIIKCREDYWMLVERTDFSDSDKLKLFNRLWKGRFNELDKYVVAELMTSAGDEWENILADLDNIKYMFPISHAIEYYEYRNNKRTVMSNQKSFNK